MSRAIPATAPTRNASAFATPTGTHDIKVLRQDGKGKGDAVRKGFAAATGDILMILDADLTMPPEALPKYHAVIDSGKAEFVNGTRLVYPMEDEAMRRSTDRQPLLRLPVQLSRQHSASRDTLCGTKVLSRTDYEAMRADAPISAISIRSAISI